MTDEEYNLDDKPKNQSKTRAAELHAMRDILRTNQGRDFMWRLLQQTGIFDTCFDKDPVVHAFKAGCRESGLWLQRELRDASTDLYLKMLKEHENGW
jgi:hypothetical protein